MSPDSEEDTFSITLQELHERYIRRARGVMMNYYAADERIHIHGLHLQKSQPDGAFWDIVDLEKNDSGEVESVSYIDTIDVSKFASARTLANQVREYSVAFSTRGEEADPDEDDTDDPDPTRSFQ